MSGPAKGGKIGKSLADVFANVLLQHTELTTPLRGEATAKTVNTISDHHEAVLREHLAPFFEGVVNNEDLPQHVRDLAATLGAPTHGPEVILLIAAVMMLVREFAGAALAPLIEDVAKGAWHAHPTAPLSPAEAALGVLRGHVSHAEGVALAEETGINPTRFETILNNTGEPPGLEMLLAAYRRAIIPQDRLERGIRQSRVRNEWIPTVEAMRYAPMSPGDAIAAAVQSHLSIEKSKEIAAQGGLRPDHWQPLYETRGRPPGPGQLQDLYNRGEITRAQFDQGVRESDIKNKYIDAIYQLRVYLPPPRSVNTLLHAGVITMDKAVELYRKNGLDHEMSVAYATAAKHEKNASHKQLATSQIVRLYQERTIDRAKATTLLEEIGWDKADSAFILGLGDHERERSFSDGAVRTIHSRYIGWRIDRSQASADLDALKVATQQRNDLIKLWDLERGASTRTLTEAQVIGAWLRNILDDTDTLARLARLGYSQEDASLLLAIASTPAPTPPPSERHLTTAQIVKAWKTDLITREQAVTQLIANGYTDADANLLLDEAQPPAKGTP